LAFPCAGMMAVAWSACLSLLATRNTCSAKAEVMSYALAPPQVANLLICRNVQVPALRPVWWSILHMTASASVTIPHSIWRVRSGGKCETAIATSNVPHRTWNRVVVRISCYGRTTTSLLISIAIDHSRLNWTCHDRCSWCARCWGQGITSCRYSLRFLRMRHRHCASSQNCRP